MAGPSQKTGAPGHRRRTRRLSPGLALLCASCRSFATRSTYMRVTVRLECPRSFWRAKAPLVFRRKPFVAWVKKELFPRWGQDAPGSALALAWAAIHI